MHSYAYPIVATKANVSDTDQTLNGNSAFGVKITRVYKVHWVLLFPRRFQPGSFRHVGFESVNALAARGDASRQNIGTSVAP